MEEEKRLGRTIRGLRKKQKLSQGELAERADVSLMTISRIERGEHDPHIRTLKRIADGLGVGLLCLMRSAGFFEGEEEAEG